MSALAAEPETPGRALSAEELALTHPLVEAMIGRPLRLSEQAIDVLRLDGALNRAKDELTAAIKAEQRRSVKRRLWNDQPLDLLLTREMLRPLERLYRLGREEGLAELRRAGYAPIEPVRAYVEHAKRPRYERLGEVWATMRRGLSGLSVRVEHELVTLDLTDASSTAIALALMSVPGGRDLASRVVSSALDAGFAQTFETNGDLVDGWEWTSVLDGATCDPCEEGDGTQYPSWEAAQADLPNGGPAVACLGGQRCRCRLVPLVAP